MGDRLLEPAKITKKPGVLEFWPQGLSRRQVDPADQEEDGFALGFPR